MFLRYIKHIYLGEYMSSEHDQGMENILKFAKFLKCFEKRAENWCINPYGTPKEVPLRVKCQNFKIFNFFKIVDKHLEAFHNHPRTVFNRYFGCLIIL